MARPITQAERDQVAKLHAAGLGRNEIARTIDRNVATVTKIAGQLGLSFDRSATRAATAAKVIDAKAKRAQLMQDLLDDAAKLRAQMWEPHEYVDHGGKDFDEARWTQPEPTAADKLKLMQAAKAALDSSMRLDHHDTDGGTEGARSMVAALAEGLQVAYERIAESEPDNAAGD